MLTFHTAMPLLVAERNQGRSRKHILVVGAPGTGMVTATKASLPSAPTIIIDEYTNPSELISRLLMNNEKDAIIIDAASSLEFKAGHNTFVIQDVLFEILNSGYLGVTTFKPTLVICANSDHIPVSLKTYLHQTRVY